MGGVWGGGGGGAAGEKVECVFASRSQTAVHQPSVKVRVQPG